MSHIPISSWVIPFRKIHTLPDAFALALAISLPWSTTATGILAVLWLVSLIPTLRAGDLKVLQTPAALIPLLLAVLAVLGCLWANTQWSARFDGLVSFLRLICIPLFIIQFSKTGTAREVLLGLIGSCVVLLFCSWLLFFCGWYIGNKPLGVPVKDYIAQSAFFTTSALIIAPMARDAWNRGRSTISMLLVVVILLFVANIFFIAASRTYLIGAPILLAWFGYVSYRWKGVLVVGCCLLLIAGAAWTGDSFFRARTGTFLSEITGYQPTGKATSAGERITFWRKSLEFIETAPVLGHGTGSIRSQFNLAAVDEAGMAGERSANPHNQVFAVGIQLGCLGIIILIAMWIAHLVLFKAAEGVAWAGIVIVAQNIIGSLFNSHLFDFTHAWLYIIGVGVAGGEVLRSRIRKPPQPL